MCFQTKHNYNIYNFILTSDETTTAAPTGPPTTPAPTTPAPTDAPRTPKGTKNKK